MYYGYGYGFGSGGSLLMLILLMLLASMASMGVKSTFNKYHRIRSARNMTGAEAAQLMLNRNGLYDVKIERIGGSLTDHYDPRTKTIRLSDPVYSNASVASISVACHEVGHAIQHEQGYVPLSIRTAILPAAQLGSQAAWPLFLFGLFFSISGLMQIGIIFFAFSVVFQLVTLPVEFNASARALENMEANGILIDEENKHAKKVLRAAAMTYVAAAAMAIGQLLRLLLLANRRD